MNKNVKCFEEAALLEDELPSYYLTEKIDAFLKLREGLVDHIPASVIDTPVIPDETECLDYIARVCHENLVKKVGELAEREVSDRLDKELAIIKKCGYGSYFYLLKLMAAEIRKKGGSYFLAGAGSSLLVLNLLDVSHANPLPRYGFCEACGSMEFLPDQKSGEVELCSTCGAPLRCDGFNLPYQMAFGVEGEITPDVEFRFDRNNLTYMVDFVFYALNTCTRNILPKTHICMCAHDYLLPYCEPKKDFSGDAKFIKALKEYGYEHSTSELSFAETEKYGIFYRDDLYKKLIEFGLFDKEAVELTNYIGKGKANKKGFTEEQLQILRRADIPEDYIELFKKIIYLWPKAHAVEQLLAEI